MKKIIVPKITISLSDKEVCEINELIDRDTELHGIPAMIGKTYVNRCPKCSVWFSPCAHFCDSCGQRVKFIESDVISFESEVEA